MTRKDYIKIAEVLFHERPDRDGSKWADGARDSWSTTVLAFAKMLEGTNPNFDRSRFLTACGYKE